MGLDTKNVDWDWINSLAALPIYEAAAVSLGYELGTLGIIDLETVGKQRIDIPEHRARTALTYEWARTGKIKLTGFTCFKNEVLDVTADFLHGQAWDVDLLDFRKFCDFIGWEVPKEFSPIGYAAIEQCSKPSASQIKRRNLLDPIIEDAQKTAKNPLDAAEIWPKLVDMAKEKKKPLFGVTDTGIQWMDANDSPKEFTIKMLRERLKRRGKPR
jgi:hypothetical protein